MSNVVMLIGVSGSGKSTLAKQVKTTTEDTTSVICSTDKFIEEEALSMGITYQEMMDKIQKDDRFRELTGKFYDEIEDCVKNDYNIVIDRTNLTSGGRKALIEKLKTMHEKHGKDMEVMALCLNLTEVELGTRIAKRKEETGKTIPDHVLKTQLERLELPDKEEGFDYVEVYEKA